MWLLKGTFTSPLYSNLTWLRLGFRQWVLGIYPKHNIPMGYGNPRYTVFGTGDTLSRTVWICW